MNLEEYNHKTFEGVSWIVKLYLAVFYGLLIGLFIRAMLAMLI